MVHRCPTKHANFFVAGTGATAQDVHDLVWAVRRRVGDATGVWLRPEIRFAGEFASVTRRPDRWRCAMTVLDPRIARRRRQVAEHHARRRVRRLVILWLGVVAGVVAWGLQSPFLSVRTIRVEGASRPGFASSWPMPGSRRAAHW